LLDLEEDLGLSVELVPIGVQAARRGIVSSPDLLG